MLQPMFENQKNILSKKTSRYSYLTTMVLMTIIRIQMKMIIRSNTGSYKAGDVEAVEHPRSSTAPEWDQHANKWLQVMNAMNRQMPS